MPAKFEIRTTQAGEYTWVLTSQGRTLAVGETYPRKASAQNAIESFRKGAAAATVADLTLPPARTAPGKVARVAGRLAARAVIKGAKVVETVEQAAATTTHRAAKKVAKASAAKAAPAKKSGGTRKRGSRTS